MGSGTDGPRWESEEKELRRLRRLIMVGPVKRALRDQIQEVRDAVVRLKMAYDGLEEEVDMVRAVEGVHEVGTPYGGRVFLDEENSVQSVLTILDAMQHASMRGGFDARSSINQHDHVWMSDDPDDGCTVCGVTRSP